MPQYFGQLPTIEQPWSTPSAVQSISVNGADIDFKCQESRLRLSVLAPNLIRVRFIPSGEFLPRRSWAVTLEDTAWEKTAFEVEETPETVEIQTEKIRVKVWRDRPRLCCYNPNGKPFACDGDPGLGWHTGNIAGWKQIETDEHFYGLGERTGLIDKQGEIKTNWTVDAVDYDSLTDQMYQAIPLVMVLRPQLAYGIFFNTTYWSRFDFGVKKPGIWRMETRSCELDYYIIYGPAPANIIRTYSQLTGKMPLPPRWALGYHQSRWGYDTENLVREIAHEFRNRQIPCDVIHLDIDYMLGFRVFTWSQKRFGQPAKMLKDLKQMGFQVVTIVDPGVKYEPEADYNVFDEGLKNDYFVRKPDGELFYGYVWPDKAVFPDFLNPKVRYWWGECQKQLTDAGVAGIWNDMNEPSISDRPFGDRGQKIWFPLDTQQGTPEEPTNHAETHNLYGLMMAKACYEGLQRSRPHERSFVLTRAGYAGIQRYSSVWMGDNQAIWEHLELSLPMLCNMGLSGVPFVGCDIGGFAGNTNAELLTRWMQVGMLYPLMRCHSAMSTVRREPWAFGSEIELICRTYLELRYQLLPYLYSLFWQAATEGTPILRPLVYEYPNDPKTYKLHDQVFLGESLMAAPICRPGLECRAVYLPEGTWYDWWSGDRYVGPTHILAHAPLETMPFYVKAGSIIPLQPVRQSAGETDFSELTLRVYPGTGQFTCYEDDGHSFAYRQGNWATTTYQVVEEGQQVIVDIAPRQGQWKPTKRNIIVEVVGYEKQSFIDDGNAHQLIINKNKL